MKGIRSKGFRNAASTSNDALKDASVLTDLELCAQGKCFSCSRQYGTYQSVKECKQKLLLQVIDFIDRKKAKIKEKEEMLSHQADVIKTLERALVDKMAEIERLKQQLNSKYKWENMLDKKIKEIRSETRKELAERLKEKSDNVLNFSSWKSAVCIDDIDNLVEEMEECK